MMSNKALLGLDDQMNFNFMYSIKGNRLGGSIPPFRLEECIDGPKQSLRCHVKGNGAYEPEREWLLGQQNGGTASTVEHPVIGSGKNSQTIKDAIQGRPVCHP